MDNKYLPEEFSDRLFASLDLFVRNRSVSDMNLATAIEAEGIYTWDKYGRFLKCEVGDGTLLAEKALELLAHIHEVRDKFINYPQAILTPDRDVKNAIDQSLLDSFGWPAQLLPDFDSLELEWIAQHLGKGVANVPEPKKEIKKPAQERIIAALLVTAFPKEPDLIVSLNNERTDITEKIYNKLMKTGYRFNKKTLLEYIKYLPFSGE